MRKLRSENGAITMIVLITIKYLLKMKSMHYHLYF